MENEVPGNPKARSDLFCSLFSICHFPFVIFHLRDCRLHRGHLGAWPPRVLMVKVISLILVRQRNTAVGKESGHSKAGGPGRKAARGARLPMGQGADA